MKRACSSTPAGVMIMDQLRRRCCRSIFALRPRRGGLPRPEPEHLPGASAARPSAEGHRRNSLEKKIKRRARQDAAATTARATKPSARTSAAPVEATAWPGRVRAEPQGAAAGSAALLLLHGEEARHPGASTSTGCRRTRRYIYYAAGESVDKPSTTCRRPSC